MSFENSGHFAERLKHLEKAVSRSPSKASGGSVQGVIEKFEEMEAWGRTDRSLNRISEELGQLKKDRSLQKKFLDDAKRSS